MAYIPLTTQEISAGEPTKQELFSKIKANQDDFDSRIGAVETLKSMPLHFHVDGPLDVFDPEVDVDVQRISFDITILAGRLITHTAGSSGSNEIDILYKRGAGAWTSIFSTRPVVAFGAGNFAINTGILSVTSLLAGDLLKLNVISVQVGGKSLIGVLEFEGA